MPTLGLIIQRVTNRIESHCSWKILSSYFQSKVHAKAELDRFAIIWVNATSIINLTIGTEIAWFAIIMDSRDFYSKFYYLTDSQSN